jgi:capsular exopolysaccharide synthesis family protein
LIEADLRHPNITKNFDIDDGKPGLSNFLLSYSDLREVIHSTDVPQLFVLPSGSIVPPNPSELLQSGEMNELLGRLKEDFDYIIVDSSPAIGIADSLVISTIVDATVVVASTGITMRRDIAHLVKQISDVNARFLGVVVNRVELGRDTYYYDRYYKNYYSSDITRTKSDDMGVVNSSRQKESDERGELKNNSYATLLMSLMNQKRTGVLNIDSQLKLRIYFLEGSPVFVDGGDNKTRLGSIAFAERKIKQEDYQRVLEKVSQTKKKIGEVLIEMGFISPHELDWLLEFQVKEKLIRGFECTTGTYSFKSRNDFVDSILIYKVNPLQVIYEGTKRFADPVDIEREIFPKEKMVVVASEPELLERLKSIGFSPREYRFLQHLNRLNTISDISSINLLSRGDTLKLLCFLNCVGLVKTTTKETVVENQSAL